MRKHARALAVFAAGLLLPPAIARSQTLGREFPPPIPESTIRAILNEASGEAAFAHTRFLSSFARYPNSNGFHRAAEYVAEQARAIGLSNIEIHAFEVDEPSWDYRHATLWLAGEKAEKLADTDLVGVALCNNSQNADIQATLVDVAEGTEAADYEGKDVKGRIVLAAGNPRAVQQEAVFKRGAAGLISYFSNSFFGVVPSPDAVSWGRILSSDANGSPGGFGFMLSPSQGEALHRRLARGQELTVRAKVEVTTSSPGHLEMVTAELPGAQPAHDDIVFSAHLDHQQPGANDNASGSATLLEIARTLKSLIDGGALRRPRRTMRFWWVKEISGTYEYFYHHLADAGNIAFNINIDQAGGDRNYRNDLVYFQSPRWLPSFCKPAFDLLCEYMQAHYADVYHAPSPLFTAPTGRQDEPLTYRAWQFAPLTDHIVFETAGIGIPSISLAYPSFHYIHTSADGIETIDATSLKRMVFLGTAMALYLSEPPSGHRTPFESQVIAKILQRRELGWLRAADVLAAATAASVHEDFYRAVAIGMAGEHFAAGELLSFSALGRDFSDLLPETHRREQLNALRANYVARCKALGAAPRPGFLPEAAKALQRRHPALTEKARDDFRGWQAVRLPGLRGAAGTELKSFVDGRRSGAEIWQLLVAEHPSVTVQQVVSALEQLVADGWLR